ncbi:hypothetical protein O6H91_12G088200 [Diphasiastrum complanatum]|uniref:Uncharacterized protein n=2 Tax=Diphasiastrum complanatum TaxID=34168 RepID=A0ACC2C4J5_DIPCM|nr:hypothetical protein O6H91_12G088200 [Diphasiastrum complanatum]
MARESSKEDDLQYQTLFLPPHILAEAIASLRGLDLRWSSPITPSEMRYVEQYVKARYPEYYGRSQREEKSSSLQFLKDDLEYSEDSCCSTPGAQLDDTKKRSPVTGSPRSSKNGSPRSSLSGSKENSAFLPQKMQLEPSRLVEIVTKKFNNSDNLISIPEIHVRNRVLRHCGVTEEDYVVIFTTGLKEAMMLVGESYPFFRYNYYMTVLDEETDFIREFASFKEAKVVPAPVSWLDLRIAGSQLSQNFRKKSKHNPKGLFAYPAQIGGTRITLHWVSEAQRNLWNVLLDGSTLVLCEDQLNLTLHKPDYVLCTLSKVVGHPTSMTCLLVRRSSFENFV